MKKKIIGSVLVLGIVAVAAGLFVPNAVQKITKESVITSSQLEKAVDISELSTAEFIYNGIADKYSDGNLEETECHIAYASTVKVGIALDQITFTIDEEKKTVTPVLPEITVNTVTVDPDSLSFIPQNPDVELFFPPRTAVHSGTPPHWSRRQRGFPSTLSGLRTPPCPGPGTTRPGSCPPFLASFRRAKRRSY